MSKKFILKVEYDKGKANVITDKPNLLEALQEFLKEYQKVLPDTKMYGPPCITKAEILPIMYIGDE